MGLIRRRQTNGATTRKRIADRVTFAEPPSRMGRLAEAIDGIGARLVVLDYVQRIAPPGGASPDLRTNVPAVMEATRRFADFGLGVPLVSALSRSPDGNAKPTYAKAGMVNLRESSEIEYGGDSAYVLNAAGLLRCVKNRHGEPGNIPLAFDGAKQRFDVLADRAANRETVEPAGRIAASLAAAWDAMPAAGEGR